MMAFGVPAGANRENQMALGGFRVAREYVAKQGGRKREGVKRKRQAVTRAGE
jgi:hypothetical protein